MKRLVMCCDGTWNTPDQSTAGQARPTNVTKIALALSGEDGDGVEQRVFYQRGVGTERWERLRGGALGFGLSRDVRDTYRFVVESFEPGDELFFFGFSRGAFTARSTVGLIRNAGVLRPEHAGRVDEAYALYRDRDDRKHPRGDEATLFRHSYSHEPPIRFVGVFDTVGALGIPLSGPLATLVNRAWGFHNTDLSSRVQAAFQALSIDEQRPPFKPAVWKPSAPAQGQRIEQVWFAGVHCDVGGGYVAAESGLPDIALLWMADRAHACGLAFRPDLLVRPSQVVPDIGQKGWDGAVRPKACGNLHDSKAGLFRWLPSHHRPIGTTDSAHEFAASTVVDRQAGDLHYAPQELERYLASGKHQVMDLDAILKPLQPDPPP
jgi:uncharacterized protein (DUF2235 family)